MKFSPLGFTIPVIVRVTDVNDNTPNFIDSPYHLNISGVNLLKLFSFVTDDEA
jgi:hypothetical protein